MLKCKGPNTETWGTHKLNLKDVERIPETVTQENQPVMWLHNNWLNHAYDQRKEVYLKPSDATEASEQYYNQRKELQLDSES